MRSNDLRDVHLLELNNDEVSKVVRSNLNKTMFVDVALWKKPATKPNANPATKPATSMSIVKRLNVK